MHRIITIIIGQCLSTNVLEGEVMPHRQQSETGGLAVYCCVVYFTEEFGKWKSERGFGR